MWGICLAERKLSGRHKLRREVLQMAKVRLADIAAQVGVSTVTVHNALT